MNPKRDFPLSIVQSMKINTQAPSLSDQKAPRESSGRASAEKHVQAGSQRVGKKMPPDPKMNPILAANTHNMSMTLRRSYGMVISSYENVAEKNLLGSDVAEQLGRTIQVRINELNAESRRKIEDLQEYQNLDVENIQELGEELADMMTEKEDYLQAFALMKNSVFAELMESSETVHRSFSEMMKANGEERLMFGVLEMIKDMGGLVGLEESKQVEQENGKVNIRV